MIVRKKPIVIEAITFEEFVDFGLKNAETLIDVEKTTINDAGEEVTETVKEAWSFEYKNTLTTKENDICYLINNKDNNLVVGFFTINDVLLTDSTGAIKIITKETFNQEFVEVKEKVK